MGLLPVILTTFFFVPCTPGDIPGGRVASGDIAGEYIFSWVRILDEFDMDGYRTSLQEAFPGGVVDREYAADELSTDLGDYPYDLLFPGPVPQRFVFDGDKCEVTIFFKDGQSTLLRYTLYRDCPGVAGSLLAVTDGERRQYYPVAGLYERTLLIKCPVRTPLNMPFSVGESYFTYIFAYSNTAFLK